MRLKGKAGKDGDNGPSGGAGSCVHGEGEVVGPLGAGRDWIRSVLHGWGAAGLPSGEFVDLPVAQRARRLLELAATVRHQRT